MPIPNFRPGDLIDAIELINYLSELDGRVHTLELRCPNDPVPPQGQVVITQLIPAVDIRIGEELRILGREFYFSRGAARVELNGFPRTIKPASSSDTELRIDIPVGTPLGTANIHVSNSFTFADRTINILPAQTPLAGNVQVTFLFVNPRQIDIGTISPVAHFFFYELDAAAMSRASRYTIEPVISVSDWDLTARVVDEAGADRSSEFSLTPGQRVTFGVRVDLQVGTGRPSSFGTRIDITAEDRSWHLADRTFRNGETVLPTEPGVRLGAPQVAPTGAFDDVTNTIRGAATLMIQADFTVIGRYTLINRPVDGSSFTSNNWAADPDVTPLVVDVTEQTLSAGGGTHRVPIGIIFTPLSGARTVDIEVGYGTSSTQTVDHFTLTT
jgi:hypothetical protein